MAEASVAPSRACDGLREPADLSATSANVRNRRDCLAPSPASKRLVTAQSRLARYFVYESTPLFLETSRMLAFDTEWRVGHSSVSRWRRLPPGSLPGSCEISCLSPSRTSGKSACSALNSVSKGNAFTSPLVRQESSLPSSPSDRSSFAILQTPKGSYACMALRNVYRHRWDARSLRTLHHQPRRPNNSISSVRNRRMIRRAQQRAGLQSKTRSRGCSRRSVAKRRLPIFRLARVQIHHRRHIACSALFSWRAGLLSPSLSFLPTSCGLPWRSRRDSGTLRLRPRRSQDEIVVVALAERRVRLWIY